MRAYQRPPAVQGAEDRDCGVATSDEAAAGLDIPQIIVGCPSPAVEPLPPDPRYHSLTFRPDVTIDGWATEVLTMRGVSQRGHLHRYNGAPRQDEFAVQRLPGGRVIVLVADGVSAAMQSHIGASIAVRQAAEWLRSNIGNEVAELDWTGLIQHTAYALNVGAQSLFKLADPDPVRAEQELATTLVCAVIEPLSERRLRAHLVAVGDSSAWLLSSGQFVEVLGGKVTPESGVASSEVAALPRIPERLTPVVIDIATDDVLLIGTDGIGDPLGSGNGAVGDLFRDLLTRFRPPSLIEFAHAVDFSRENFDDDRTLVAVWPRRAEP